MFHMLHDGCIPFIFNSLLNPIVFLMFQTKINPFQNWLFPSWPRRNVYILLSFKSDRFPYVSNQNTGFKSDSHMYMFHIMFYMFRDRGVTFIFYSLLNLIVFLMFPTKINPFQKWLFQERIFICFICFICFMTET